MINPNMQGIASLVAQQGRNGDTMLMHVAPEEVQYLDSIGGITRNPVTDLPEAFKLKDLLPFVGQAFLGPAFKAAGFSPGISNFLASTATTMLGGGSLEKGIMSGLVSSSIGRLGQNLADTAGGLSPEQIKARDSGYKFGIFKAPQEGTTFGSRYSEAFRSPQFNPVEMFKGATEGGLENLLEQVQKPGVIIPFSIGAGELARMNAEERYARDFANFQEAQKRRRAELQLKYPQILPGPRVFPTPPTGFNEGGMVQRKFDGEEFAFSSDENNFPSYLNELLGIVPEATKPETSTQYTVSSQSSAPAYYRWSDGTYNRNPESSGIRTPFNELPPEYQAQDSRRPQQETKSDKETTMPTGETASLSGTSTIPDETGYKTEFINPPPDLSGIDTSLVPQASLDPMLGVSLGGRDTVMPTGEDIPLTSAPVASSPTNLSEEDKFALMSNLFANLAGAQPVLACQARQLPFRLET